MEDSFEGEVRRLWNLSHDDLLVRLSTVLLGLTKWAKALKGEKKRSCHEFSNKLEELLPMERDDAVVEELINAKGSIFLFGDPQW